MSEIKDILIKTKDIIEERGWTKGQLICKEGKVCLDGALSIALGWNPVDVHNPSYRGGYATLEDDKTGAVKFLAKNITGFESAAVSDIFRFNDGHSEEEVIQALDKAIANA